MTETIRNCDTCKFKSSEVRPIGNMWFGMVDFCEKDEIIYKAEPCEFEETRLLEKVRAKLNELREGLHDKI